MRKLVLTALVFIVGCDLIKKKDDGADAAADAATAAVDDAAAPTVAVDAGAPAPAPVAVNAKNVADVARFPGEAAVPDDDSKLAQPTAARTAPKGGSVVAMIKPGADVTKIAEYQNSFLVSFADPKDASSVLMGWIGKEAFTAPTIVTRDGGVKLDAGPAPVVDAGPPPALKCSAGTVAVVLSTTPVCKKKCTKDADCTTKAAGSCAPANTVAGSVTRVCASD